MVFMVSFSLVDGASFLVFIVFLVVAYYVFHVIKNSLIIAVISMAFPFLSNAFLGTSLPISISSIFQFAAAGMGVYLLYELLKWAVRASKVAAHIIGILLWPFKLVLGFLKRLLFGGKKKGA